MIKATELKDTGKPGFRIREEQGFCLTLGMIKEKFIEENEKSYGLPIKILDEQVKSGGIFNSSIEDCLIITNIEHVTDYFKYCITLRKQGRIATVQLNYYGMSKLTGKMNAAEERKKNGSLSGMLINAIAGPNKEAVQTEYDYYDMVEQIFAEIMA